MEAIGIVVTGLVLGVLVIFGWALVISWPIMLLLGTVHTFLWFVPALGYWQTVAVYILVRLFFGSVSTSSKD